MSAENTAPTHEEHRAARSHAGGVRRQREQQQEHEDHEDAERPELAAEVGLGALLRRRSRSPACSSVPWSAASTWRRKDDAHDQRDHGDDRDDDDEGQCVPVRLMDVASAARTTRSRPLMHPPDRDRRLARSGCAPDPNTSDPHRTSGLTYITNMALWCVADTLATGSPRPPSDNPHALGTVPARRGHVVPAQRRAMGRRHGERRGGAASAPVRTPAPTDGRRLSAQAASDRRRACRGDRAPACGSGGVSASSCCRRSGRPCPDR